MAFNVQNMNALIVDLKAKGVTSTQEPDAQPWGIYAMIRDQTQAYDVYVNKLGFKVHTDMTMENGFRWLTVTPPGQPEVEIVLSEPVEPMFSPDLIPHVRALLDRDAMSGGVWEADDCQKTYEELKTRGIEFLKPPTKEFYGIEALFKDGCGNWFSLTERPKE